MKIGVCGGFDRIVVAADCGYDYIETNFKDLAKSSEEDFQKFLAALQDNNIACEAANCFLPGELKVTGENVDYESLKAYLAVGFKRAAEAGIKVVVFGSGGARNIPDGYSYKDAINDIIKFMKEYAAPMAAEYEIDLVFEPLRKKETNIINTIKEGAMLVSAINLPNVGTLGDLFHMHVEGDTYDDVRDLKGIFRHAHMSYPESTDKRVYMKESDDFDYKGFFEALKYVGCERVSIEAGTDDFETDAREAIKVMNLYK